MPKRRHSNENIEDYVNRKIRKIEKKLRKRRINRQRSSSQDSLKDIDEPLQNSVCERRSSSFDLPEQSIECIKNIDPPREALLPLSDLVDISLEQPNNTASVNVSSEPLIMETTLADVQIAKNKEAEDILPGEILEILGEAPTKDKKFAPALNSKLAIRWEHTATSGLPKDVKKDIFEKHAIPENCKNIDAPILNQEVKAALSVVLNKKDRAIENKQKQIALIIACVGDALSQVLSNDSTNIKLIKPLTDAGRLACDLQHTESMIRRSFVCSSIRKEIKDHLYTTQIDSHLFGNQLGDVIKAAKAVNKTGAEMKTATVTPGPSKRTNQYLNTKRPAPSSGRQTGAAARRPITTAPNNRPEYQRQQRRVPLPQTQPRASYKRSQTHAPLRR